MKYYRTLKPERAAEKLCAEHKLVLALQWLQLIPRMALRQSEIKNATIYHQRSRTGAEANIAAWHKTGGLFILEQTGKLNYGHANAILRVEAPVDMADIEAEALSCTDEFVISHVHPWTAYRASLADLVPPVEVCKRFWQTLEIYKGKKPRNMDLAILKLLELPEAGTICVHKTEFYKTAGISARQMNKIVYASHRYLDQMNSQHYATPVILRFEPEGNENYRRLFNWIGEHCPKYLQYHVIRGGEPGPEFPRWKNWLREMHYAGFVEKADEINIWQLSGQDPDFSLYDARHHAARTELEKVIQFVEALPEFPGLS
jgi:hypothetical protein